MYTKNDIIRLQTDDEFRLKEGDKYCLISLDNRELFKQDLINHNNFCVLQVINAYKNNILDKNNANRVLNKIDALVYAKDMLGIRRVIEKLNSEIIEEELHIPFFNSLCIICENLYDNF